MSDHPTVMIKTSSLHQHGLFAQRAFRRNDIVVKWENTREISASELASLPVSEKNYIEIQGDKILLIGTPERFVNHSCEANTFPGDRCDIALRDIQAGEEITTDYSHFYIPCGEFQCHCGSQKCRGVIRGVPPQPSRS